MAESLGQILDRLQASGGEVADQGVGALLALASRNPQRLFQMARHLDRDPATPDSDLRLAMLLALVIMLDDPGLVAALDDRLAARNPADLWPLRVLSKAAWIRGRPDAALAWQRRAIEMFPQAARPPLELAALRFATGDVDGALDLMGRTLPRVKGGGFVGLRDAQQDRMDSLRDAMAQGRDAGDRDLVGWPGRYLEPESVVPMWTDHDRDCGRDNTFRTVAAYTNTVMFDAIAGHLKADPGITAVINFGTGCGRREWEIAPTFPQVTWIGYDFSPLATDMNRQAFQRPNLRFDDDLDEALAAATATGGRVLLAHCRTADVMLPAALRRVYAACRKAGVARIVTGEYFCPSIETLNYPDFRAETADTVYWDGILVMHNYARMLPSEGYALVADAYHPVPLPHNDHGLQEALLIRLTDAVPLP
ncbi:MAG: hypothetical protein KDE22_13155 [Rhodobacterales bacterium]|nr:hypothetical protein [Rhodobacterales bacterium]